MFQDLSQMKMQHGELEYHETARIVSMKPHGISSSSSSIDDIQDTSSRRRRRRVVVATAGTTDIAVAEEAAVVLEATGSIQVDRIYDAGVAGLHRIVQALPRLRHDDVGAIIVCAGMDGALPSVVGGLVTVPVIAVPTSIGYGASFGGVSALLTMINSCAPGVGVVNIDNGFGAAVLAFKCLGRR
jgi:pyridinium-3,5-biscarboxylic acid mononucleotide synthase